MWCRMYRNHNLGAISYADDITLISPSVKGLQCMIGVRILEINFMLVLIIRKVLL